MGSFQITITNGAVTPNPALKRTAAPPLSFALERASGFVVRRVQRQDSGDIILPSTSRKGDFRFMVLASSVSSFQAAPACSKGLF
jgi:hypothetical protein